MIDLTIGIPVYNGQSYLFRCLKCIPSKTSMRLEILLLDDGSTDKTRIFMKQAADADTRIRILGQPSNRGISRARNRIIEESRGTYLYFADVDDTFDFTGIEALYRNAEKDRLDVSIGYRIEMNEQTGKIRKSSPKTKDSGVLSGSVFFLLSATDKFQGIGPHQNLYRTSFLRENHLAYTPNLRNEDNEFFPRVHQVARRVRFVNMPFYQHRLRPGSLSDWQDPTKGALNRIRILSLNLALSNPENPPDFEKALSGLIGYNLTRWAELYARIEDKQDRKKARAFPSRKEITRRCLKAPRQRYKIRGLIFLLWPHGLKFLVHPGARRS